MINLLRWILRRVINLIADVKITGLENIPTTGAFVIATNHLGFLDVHPGRRKVGTERHSSLVRKIWELHFH